MGASIDNIDWGKTADELVKILKDKFLSKLKADAQEALEKLKVIAQDVVRYWQLSLKEGDEGDTARENLEWIKAEVKLLYAKYAVRNTAAMRQAAINWVELLATVGATALRALILAGA